MIYKCVMCDTVFTQKPLLYMHFDTHLAKQKVHVFKCPDCTKLYAQKGSMMEHIKVRFLMSKHSDILDNKLNFAFMCCPFIVFYGECGVNKGIQQFLGSALARFLPGGLVLSSIPSTVVNLVTELGFLLVSFSVCVPVGVICIFKGK